MTFAAAQSGPADNDGGDDLARAGLHVLAGPDPGFGLRRFADETRVSDFVLALNGAFLTQQLQLDDEAMQEWQQLTARNADRDRLSRFIEQYLPTDIAQSLLAQFQYQSPNNCC